MGEHTQLLRIVPDQTDVRVQPPKHQVQPNPAASPPSASTSPSHEFSFTISLHPPATAAADKPSPPPFIDLSPADEIFFHGHLLPLHLLSHLPVSARSSTDSFTLPVKELLHDRHDCAAAPKPNSTNNTDDDDDRPRRHQEKPKSFSLFGIPRWRKNCSDQEKDDDDRKRKPSKFDLFKRYVRLVKPFLSLRNRRGNSSDEFLRQQPYSYSGNLRLRPNKKELRGRRGEFSAPASMITSPTNSGLLVASGSATPTSSASDSTMEELQAAIQAAIAHCKKSIATEDTIIVP